MVGILGTGNMPLWEPYISDANDFREVSPGTHTFHNFTNYEANVALTKILTHQTLKFGFETRRYYDNFITSGAANGWQGGGWWRFNQQPTSYAVGDFAASDIREEYANGYSGVLLGILDYDPTFGGTSRGTNFNYYAGYVQDDVHVNSKLTLNLGLRWDMESPLTERNNKFFLLDPKANISSIGISIDPNFNWNNAVAAAGVNPSDRGRALVGEHWRPAQGHGRASRHPAAPQQIHQLVASLPIRPACGLCLSAHPQDRDPGLHGSDVHHHVGQSGS